MFQKYLRSTDRSTTTPIPGIYILLLMEPTYSIEFYNSEHCLYIDKVQNKCDVVQTF